MKTQLKNVATIHRGYSFRARLEPVRGGNVAVIQMKNLPHDNTVDCENLVKEPHMVLPAYLNWYVSQRDQFPATYYSLYDRSIVSKHLKNIFTSGELEENVVCAKMAHTTQHGAIPNKTQPLPNTNNWMNWAYVPFWNV